MHKRRLWGRGVILLVAVLGVFALPRVAQATTLTLYDNSARDGSWASATNVELAQSFSTGTDPVSLAAVSFRWRNASVDNTTSVPSSYTLELFAGSGGAPTYQIATLASNVNVGTWAQGTDTYSPGSLVSLAPNSQFFVVVSGDSGGTFGWKYNTAAPNTDLVPPPSLLSLVSSDGGSTWSSVPGNFIMSVTGSALTIPVLSGFPDVSATPGEAPLVLSPPTASVPGTFSYSSTNSSVAAMAENQVTFGSVGTAAITASFFPADQTTYYPTSISATVTVANPPPPPPPPVPTTTTTTATTTTTTTLPSPISKPPTTTTTTPKSGTSTTTTTTTATTTTVPKTGTSTTTTSPTTPTTLVTTTTVPSGTTPPASTTFPTPIPPNASTFASTEGLQFVAQIDATTNTPVAGTHVTVSTIASDPDTGPSLSKSIRRRRSS